MARKTSPTEDDWRDVEDPKKRKQIQDRLAQRARRKRLRDAKNNTKQADEPAETSTLTTALQADELVPESDDIAPCLIESQDFFIASPQSSSSSPGSYTCPLRGELGLLPFGNHVDVVTSFAAGTDSPVGQPQFPITVFSALYINGQVLGLSCSTTVPAKSTPVAPNVPRPLHPTMLQLITIHPLWIDRIPIAKMRDNLICMTGCMDEEEFLKDVFTMPSFEIVPGHPTWDPEAWKMVKIFADKWGYLLL